MGLLPAMREQGFGRIVSRGRQRFAQRSARRGQIHRSIRLDPGSGETDEIFTNPRHKLTEDYITGRFG